MKARTDTERAEVLAELTLGMTPAQVAKDKKLPVTTIYTWRSEFIENGTLDAMTTELKARMVGTMAADLLVDKFEEWFAQPEKLSPQQVGILYGITTDKVIAYDRLHQDRQSDNDRSDLMRELMDTLRQQKAIGNPVPQLSEPILEGEVRDVASG